MNILQVSQSFYPCFDAGGVVRVVYEISKELAAKGHNVTVYTTDGCTKRLKVEKNVPIPVEGIKVYYFSNLSNKLKIKLKITTPYHLFKIIKKEIKNYDIIHIHEHRTILAVIVHHYAKKNNIPYIIQAHGYVLPFYQKTILKKIFDKLWGNKILNDASKAIALTNTELEQYTKMGVKEEKIVIIPNGINFSEYENLPKKGEFRKKFGIKDDEKIILYLGRINKIKGLDILMEAFSDIITDLKKVKLVIVGPDDGFLKSLKKMSFELGLNEKVLFTGPLYKENKLEAYLDAYVYVLPSVYEAFPNTVIESCACGSPVIITKSCGISDIIKDNVGCVVEHDTDSLKYALNYILKNEKFRNNLSDNCKSFVQSQIDLTNIIGKLEKIYNTETHSNSCD